MHIANDTLVAKHRRHDEITLNQIHKDTFLGSAWWFSKLEFLREEGKVTGFMLTGSRVRNLKFVKQ